MTALSGEAVWGPPPAREAVSAAVYRRLREAILRGQITAGSRVNELELAQAWNISRTPVRDALRRLEAEGLVQAVPGRGVIVPRLSRGDAESFYDVLEALEGMAARRAAERTTLTDLIHLNSLIKAYGVALKGSEHDRMAAIDEEIHLSLARAAQNPRLEREIENVRGPLQQTEVRAMLLRGRAAKSFRELAKLIAAIRARSGARAEAAMREHVASLRADALAADEG